MKLKIRRDEMVLPRYVYEDLIRDSERARVLESCIEAKAQTPEDFYRCIFGRHVGKLLDDTPYNPLGNDESNVLPDVFPMPAELFRMKDSESEPPKEPAIMVEKIEDPEDDDLHIPIPDDNPHLDSTPPRRVPKRHQ